jgi:hypothetical protein
MAGATAKQRDHREPPGRAGTILAPPILAPPAVTVGSEHRLDLLTLSRACSCPAASYGGTTAQPTRTGTAWRAQAIVDGGAAWRGTAAQHQLTSRGMSVTL